MIKHTFEDITTGGGFNHYWITYPEYGFGVLVNEEGGGNVPKEGDRFDIGVYHLEDGKHIGEHFENSFDTLENFSHAQIIARCLGYAEGLKIAKKRIHKRFLCVWNDDIFEVHDLASLYDNYKRTNLYEEQFEQEYGAAINFILDDLDINEKATFDNMEVTRLK